MRTGSSTSRTSPASFLGSNSIPTGRTTAAGRASSAATATSASRCSGRLDRQGSAEGQVRPQSLHRHAQLRAGPGGGASGILTHRGTGTFCHSFVPQRPFAGYPSQLVRPAAPGERHRVTVGGPGRTPVIQAESQGSRKRTGPRRQFNSVFDQVMPATKSAPASGNEEAPWAIRGRTRATRPRTLGRGEEPRDGSRDAFDDRQLDEDESLDDDEDDEATSA